MGPHGNVRYVKLCDPYFYSSREIQSEAIGDGIFYRLFRDTFRPEVASVVIVISCVAVEWVSRYEYLCGIW